MPKRLLREGIIDSKAVNALSEAAEVLYRRLMSIVDDYGRFEADPELIRARCFPRQLERWPVARVMECMVELRCAPGDAEENEAEALVTMYQVGRKKYLEINNFGQRIQSASKYPSREGSSEEKPIPPKSTVIHRDSPPRGRAQTKSESESESYAESESEACAGKPAHTPAAPVEIRKPPEERKVPEDAEQRIRRVADQAPDQQDYELGIELAVQTLLSAANPESALRAIESNVPLWWEAMRDNRARMKPLRFVIQDRDYLRKPREPTSKKSEHEKKREELATRPNPRLAYQRPNA